MGLTVFIIILYVNINIFFSYKTRYCIFFLGGQRIWTELNSFKILTSSLNLDKIHEKDFMTLTLIAP